LSEDDHSPAVIQNRRQAFTEGFKFAVLGDLSEGSDVGLQVITLLPKFIPPLRIMKDAEQATALLIHSLPDIDLIVILFFVSIELPLVPDLPLKFRHIPFHGVYEVPPPFEALLERSEAARQALSEDRHEESHPAPFLPRDVRQPVEPAAQFIDTMVELLLGPCLEVDRDIFR